MKILLVLLAALPLGAQQPVLAPSRTAPAGQRMNLLDRSWEDWQKRTGAQAPDFATLPSRPFLPDPLEGVTDRAAWRKRREEIRAKFEHWVTGRMPPAPGNVRATVTGTRTDGTVTLREVKLEFGPEHKATLRLELLIPPGKGPFPVFLTNHARNRPWVYPAVRRGYIACVYHAADPGYGEPDDSDRFLEVYPDYDFTVLARWAWASMRAVDYLLTMPEVAKDQIGITGHSRGGKAALISAAFDERIGAVIPSSGNTGECDPWRYTSDPFGNETLEQITGNFPHWFHPRLRFFAGREQKLPVEQNELMALVAPRGMMMYSSYSEAQGNSFGMEQMYRSVRTVYGFLGKPDNLWLHLRSGEHATTAADVEKFVDFFDTVFGRHAYPRQETLVHRYTFEDWKRRSGEKIDPAQFPRRSVGEFSVNPSGLIENQREEIRRRIMWSLGEEPPGARFRSFTRLAQRSLSSDGWFSVLLNRPFKVADVEYKALPFGDGLQADLYYPKNAPGKLPVVIWLHGLSYPTGYSRIGRSHILAMVKAGFAVIAFDQIGFGTRVLDAGSFYERYPRWSLMGKMVSDTRAAVDAAAAMENLDAGRIFLSGYDLGGKVALFSAALDERVKGIAMISGVRPLRVADDRETEGIAHYARLHGLLPRFGFFAADPMRLPVDDDELLAMVAPRVALVVAPTEDRYSRAADVARTMEAARRAWDGANAGGKLVFERPVDFNRFSAGSQKLVLDWLVKGK
jgi:dienelactone hydrolase